MALRFRKSIKLAPGVRWNVSGGGSSFRFGPRGASVTTGKRGTFLNSGIPGTGFSSRTQIGAAERRAQPERQATMTSVKLTCEVTDAGELLFTDAAGNPMPEQLVEAAKKQNRDALLGLIQTACDRVNGEVQSLAQIHLSTPNPDTPPRHVAQRFAEAEPDRPSDVKVGLLAGMMPGRKAAAAAANASARQSYDAAMDEWLRRKLEHEAAQRRASALVERVKTDPDAMEAYIEQRLQSVEWPRETDVAFEIRADGQQVVLDVDLPEIEDMPTKVAAVPARGLKLSIKEMTAAQVQKLYLGHVHGIAFRIVGEVFSALPTARVVVLSGYSQRADAKSGHVADDYLLSVQVTRDQWRGLNFQNLATVDVVEALGALGAVRNIQRNGKLLSIQPIAV